MSQTDVPIFSLAKALTVPQAIADNYGKAPTRPLRVAEAVNMQPLSSRFRTLTGSAIAYGLTDGGYNADTIALTPLGRRIVSPTAEGDDLSAKREALLKPRVIREFLTRYNGSKLPTEQIARNVLEEMGVPPDRTKETFDLILESADDVGFFRELKGHRYVDLDGTPLPTKLSEEVGELDADGPAEDVWALPSEAPPSRTSTPAAPVSNSRVFITHGKNVAIVGQLKELLTYGNLTPVVAVEQETVSKPVPEKVLDSMRSCSAAIIHVGAEQRLLDQAGNEHRMLNSNVLIEIGAAMALYGKNFILLVENGVSLPSNLQGLYEVRYTGDRLDYEATMKLLKAFHDFKK